MNTIGAIFVGIGRFIDWTLRNFLRMVLTGVVVIAAIIFIPRLMGWDIRPFQPGIMRVPSMSDALFVVGTDSRQYFTSDYEWDGDVLVLHGYWAFNGKSWMYREFDLRLTDAYGTRAVRER